VGTLITGERFDYGDWKFQEQMRSLSRMVSLSLRATSLQKIPMVENLPWDITGRGRQGMGGEEHIESSNMGLLS